MKMFQFGVFQLNLLLFGLAAVGLVSVTPDLIVAAAENVAIVRLSDALQRKHGHFRSSSQAEPVFFDLLRDESSLSNSLDLLQTVRRFLPTSVNLEWTLGRISSALGMVDVASEAFSNVTTWSEHHELARNFAVFYASMMGDDQVVISLGKTASHISELSDEAVSLALLRFTTDSNLSERRLLEETLLWQPNNLEAMFRLYVMSEPGDADDLRDQLRQFDVNAISLGHPILLDRTIAVLREMEQQEIISGETATNILRFYIWQYAASEGVATWLQTRLNSQAPSVTDQLLLAELYDRRNETVPAVYAYRRLVRKSATLPNTIVRLAQLCLHSATCDESTTEAAIMSLRTIAGEDFAANKLLLELCTSGAVLQRTDMGIDCPNPEDAVRSSVKLPGGLMYLTTDATTIGKQIAAEILGHSEDNISLGPNLLTNGTFEDGMIGWSESRVMGNQYSEGAFGLGSDVIAGIEGNYALRIDGIWLDNEDGKSVGRQGVQALDATGAMQTFEIAPGKCILAQGIYRTQGETEVPLLLIVRSVLNVTLPPTNDRWQKAIVVHCNDSQQPERAEFSVRLRSTGQLWLDDWSLQVIDDN